MWLDRLAGGPASTSGSSTPQPGSRPYSPLPRRTSNALSPYLTSQRPGHSPRSSSLSLVSNDSSASLLSTSLRPNGSGLRQSSTAPDVPDPLETLENLIGPRTSGQEDSEKRSGCIAEEDIHFNVDFGGLSLKELASRAQSPRPPSSRRPQVLDECWSAPHRLLRQSPVWLTRMAR